MTLKKLLLLILAMLLLGPFAAAAKEEPRIYVIKKGDTLWGISQRFIKDPFYWPSLWANNPMLKNPHFIYPGQKLHIYDGRIELVPMEKEEVEDQPAVEPEVAAEVEAEPEVLEEPV
ncbi:MAG: LysM peptidoglycan-binding domain-containing protein, partial [Desulfuromonadales bacterium]|nr:LysM peptidoglycan-binding domain-containing protein [Desulfuromonadales bacterium]NIR34262.1 LysM peptidoglycan-binding domain-containing protein [Desulfuromonadales bacterium]NIS42808.1 LysM peptidoglycan-binding domain-containing protein [Desulfuromonadales bacterium]